MPNLQPDLAILGFDFGMKKIGVAIGDTITYTSRPLTTIPSRDGIPSWDEIKTLINNWDINTLVVGIPYTLNGDFQETTYAAIKFANRLKAQFSIPVHKVDERLTTKMAKIRAKNSTNKQHSLDSIAAMIILEAWLQTHRKTNA